MTVFTVYVPPSTDGNVRHENAILVPESKTLLALFAPFLWLLWYRLWWAALFYALVSIALFAALTTNFGLVALLLTFVPGLFLFLEGHELRRKALERQGWKFVGIVEGEDRVEAEIRYFSNIQQSAGEQKKKPAFIKLKPNPAFPVDPGINFLADPEMS